MNKNLNRGIHPIIKIDGLSPKYLVTDLACINYEDNL